VADDSSVRHAGKQEMIMDPYLMHALSVSRHDDLVREADESRLTRQARDSHEESRPAAKPAPRKDRARRLRVA
jgi:hypothetical protein